MGIAQPYDYTNKNNHYLVTGITYDNMGDVTKDDLSNTYSYDSEGRPLTVSTISRTVSTTFHAFNRAVEQYSNGVATQIVYSPTGQKFSYMNGQALKSYVLPMVAGMQVVYNSSGLQYFRQVDWLGTGRFATNSSGGVYYDASYGPWGETFNEQGTGDRLFTGQTQDTIAGPSQGIYDFLFRQHSPTEGRWLVPDPAGLAAVDITNPQTWNRYAYVGNNPLSNVDPLGLDDTGECGGLPCRWPGPGPSLPGDGADQVCGYLCLSVIGIPGEIQINGGGGGNSGKGSKPPSNPPGGGTPVTWPNETNGIPNGLNVNFGGPLGAIIPTAQCGDITCASIGGAFAGQVVGSGPTFMPDPAILNFISNFFNSGKSQGSNWFGTNYCGPGGSGPTISGTNDPGCHLHDDCYDKYGFTPASNWTPHLPARGAHLQQCNQALCNYVSAHRDLPGSARIYSYFSTVPFGTCAESQW